MGDLPTSEASILPSAEVELDLLQICVHMGVLPTISERNTDNGDVDDMHIANSRGRSLQPG